MLREDTIERTVQFRVKTLNILGVHADKKLVLLTVATNLTGQKETIKNLSALIQAIYLA